MPLLRGISLLLSLVIVISASAMAGEILPLEVIKIKKYPHYSTFCSTHPNNCITDPTKVVIPIERMDEIREVNSFVNANVKKGFDSDIYDKEDYWAELSETDTYTGDCEDITLEKRKMLIERGFDIRSLRIAIGFHNTKYFAHAFLLVITSDGIYALDEFDDVIRRWDEAPYIYEKVEIGHQLFELYAQEW